MVVPICEICALAEVYPYELWRQGIMSYSAFRRFKKLHWTPEEREAAIEAGTFLADAEPIPHKRPAPKCYCCGNARYIYREVNLSDRIQALEDQADIVFI